MPRYPPSPSDRPTSIRSRLAKLNIGGRAGMNTVGFTRHRWSSAEKYRRIADSRFSARCSTEVGTTSGWTPSETTSVEKRSEEHTSELQSRENLVCRLLLEKKKK